MEYKALALRFWGQKLKSWNEPIVLSPDQFKHSDNTDEVRGWMTLGPYSAINMKSSRTPWKDMLCGKNAAESGQCQPKGGN